MALLGWAVPRAFSRAARCSRNVRPCFAETYSGANAAVGRPLAACERGTKWPISTKFQHLSTGVPEPDRIPVIVLASSAAAVVGHPHRYTRPALVRAEPHAESPSPSLQSAL